MPHPIRPVDWIGSSVPSSRGRSEGPEHRRMPARSGSRDQRPAASSANIHALATTGRRWQCPRCRRSAPERWECRRKCPEPRAPLGRRRLPEWLQMTDASTDRRRARGPRGVGRGSPRRHGCLDGSAAPALGSTPMWRHVRMHWRRDACRPGPAHRCEMMRRRSRRRCAASRPVESVHGAERQKRDLGQFRRYWREAGRPSPRSAPEHRAHGRGNGLYRSRSPSRPPSLLRRRQDVPPRSPVRLATCGAASRGWRRPWRHIRFVRRVSRRSGAPRRLRAELARARRRR